MGNGYSHYADGSYSLYPGATPRNNAPDALSISFRILAHSVQDVTLDTKRYP